jgi:hypothetical protein
MHSGGFSVTEMRRRGVIPSGLFQTNLFLEVEKATFCKFSSGVLAYWQSWEELIAFIFNF